MKIVSLVSSLFTLSSITANDISTYFTLAFFAILLLLIIGFLIGLWRGMWNSGFRLIFIGLLVAGAFLFTRNIADWLAGLDIKAMMSNFGVNLSNVSFNISETSTITVEITNVKDMIISAVGQVYEAVGLGSSSTTQAVELITGLTMVFLRYITFIIEVLLIVILGEPLAAFFYHVIFKWLLPRNVRKHMKVRLAGGFMNMVKVGLVGAMLLIPFTALLNTINQAFHNPDNAIAEGIDDPTYLKVMGFLDAYNDSAFAQVLFNWSVNEDGKTLDAVLMDFLTNEDMGDLQLSLSTELYTIAGIGKTILSTGIAEGGKDALLAQLLSNENLIASMFVDIASSGLIIKAIPIALAVAMNMDKVKEYVDPTLLNFDEVNWHEELLNLGEIADQVVASGVVSDVMSVPQADMVPTILNSLANPDKYPSIRQALADIDNSEFLAQVVPAVLYKLAKDDVGSATTLTVSDFLPSDWADYQGLHIGEELTLFYDCFYNMAHDIDPAFLPTLIDVITSGGGAGTSSAATPRVLGAQSNQTPGENQHATRPVSYVAGTGTMTDLIDIIRANVDEFIAILVGTLNSSGEPTGITSDGKTDLSVAGAKPCILDSSLLLYGMGNVLNYGLTAMIDSLTAGTGVTIPASTITVAVEQLQGADMAERRINYKREYGTLLEIVGAAIQNDAIAELIGAATTPSSSSSSSSAAVNPDTLQHDITPLRADSSSSASTSSENVFMDLISNEEVRDLIKTEICPLIDRSVLMNAILPSVLEALISGDSLTSTLDMVGLTPADFNFDNLAIGTEIANFIDLAGYAMNLTDITGPDAINVIADHSSDIVGVLDCIYKSNIINPKDSLGNFTSDNYYKLLEAVFGQVADLGVNTEDVAAAIESVPDDAWLTTYDGLGNVVAYGENFHMIDTIVTAVNSGLFDLMGSANILADLNAPAYDGAITSIFAAVDRSTVMSGCFGSILDGLIGNTGGLLDPTGTGTSFRNVTDWAAEGANLEFLIHSLADFGSDINSIDFMNSDPILINNLLQGLAASQIFDKPDGTYLFNQFLFEKLIATDFKTYLYDKDETETSFVGPSAFDVAKTDFDSIGSTTSVADKAAWSDEIERLVDLISEVKIFTDAHGGTDAFASLTDGSATATDIEPIILAVNNCTILHMVIYNVFDSMLGGGAMDMGSLNPADANTAALITMTKEERDTEIGLTLDIYGSIQTLGIDTGFTADKIDSVKISDLLTMLHDSKIFNTLKADKDRLAADLTVFEQTVKMIFTTSQIDTYVYKKYAVPLHSGMLSDDLIAIGNNFAGTTLDADGWLGLNGEIASLANIMETYKATAIDFTDLGTDGGGTVTTLLATPEGTVKVQNMLIAINHDAIAYPAIPNLFDDVLGSGDFVMGDLDPADANTAIMLTLDVTTRDAEIINVLDIHGSIKGLGLDTGFSSDKIDGVAINTLLTQLHDSNIFNTIKAEKSRALDDLTVFEQTYKMIITNSTMDGYIYKLYALALRSGLLSEDIISIGNDMYGNNAEVDGWMGAGNEIEKLIGILDAFKDTAIDFTDFGTNGAETVSGLMDTLEGTAKVENLLLAMNHSTIVYPAIPNLFDTMLTAGDVTMPGVDMASANTHYTGDRFMAPYDDSEISQVMVIYGDMKNISSLNYSDLSLLSNSDIDSAEILLTDFAESKIFHLEGAASGDPVDPTVFEQMMIKIMDDTGLSAQVSDTFNPNPAYYDGLVYKFVSAHEKALYIVTNYDTLYTAGDYFTDTWDGTDGEIESFLRIFRELKRIIPSMTTTTIDTSGLTPENVSDILAVLNYSNLGSDAVPKLVRDTFTTMSIGTYTEGNEEYYLSVMNYNDTELDQKDYTDYPTEDPTTTKAGLLHVMLDGFWDETVDPDAYIDMSGAFSLADYINGGKSTQNLMQFLEGSQILAPVVEDDGVSILYETRSLMFYNLLDNVDMTKYIRPLAGGTKATRSTQLEDIFTSDFDYVMEGNGLDALIVNLINLTTATDTTSLEGQGAAAAGLIESTYLAAGDTITDRAYMSSELTAGFYTDILSDDYTLAEANLGHEVDVIDFYDSDFEQLCPRESRGTEAVLSIVPEINAIVSAPTSQAEVDDLRSSFVDMGSVVACTAPGPVWVDGNSNIAQLIYASRVISNANFTAAAAAMAFGFPPVIVEDDPYVNGFVFETEGNKVCDYFETFI